MNEQEIFEFLNQKAERIQSCRFIVELDPISNSAFSFLCKQDIEISGVFCGDYSLGNRIS